MILNGSDPTTGLLLSGGLDSVILLGHLRRQGQLVQPFYVRSQLQWERFELAAVRRCLAAVGRDACRELVVLDLPLSDLYGSHWSVTGQRVPSSDCPDDAVFLPGRNALLLVKAVVWCQLYAVGRLAFGALGTSPFADASAGFLHDFARAMNRGASRRPVELWRPFADLDKRAVMALGTDLPLELTFSCLAPAPRTGHHCGRCNKCGERQAAFAAVGRTDRTTYAQPVDGQRVCPGG